MKYLLPILFLFPIIASAQTLFSFLGGVNVLINDFLFPLLISFAVLMFIVNVVRYFFVESAESDGRAKARQFMLYSIIAFVIIVALWAIVLFIANSVGLDPEDCVRKVDEYVTSFADPCYEFDG